MCSYPKNTNFRVELRFPRSRLILAEYLSYLKRPNEVLKLLRKEQISRTFIIPHTVNV